MGTLLVTSRRGATALAGPAGGSGWSSDLGTAGGARRRSARTLPRGRGRRCRAPRPEHRQGRPGRQPDRRPVGRDRSVDSPDGAPGPRLRSPEASGTEPASRRATHRPAHRAAGLRPCGSSRRTSTRTGSVGSSRRLERARPPSARRSCEKRWICGAVALWPTSPMSLSPSGRSRRSRNFASR